MSRRDVRDPIVVYTNIDGFRDTAFSVMPSTVVRIGAGHYVLVPVLNEQAGDSMVAEFKRGVALKVQSDPELFVYGSAAATAIVQDALYGATGNST